MTPASAGPTMGWSTWSLQATTASGYGSGWLNEWNVAVQSDQMVNTIQPYGYNYIHIDSGWKGGFDQYGRPMANTSTFPDGIAWMANYVHNHGQKLGIYWIPGVGTDVYNANPPIYGTSYTVDSIVAQPLQTGDAFGSWHLQIDFSKPGAQQYINSIVNQFAAWGVDAVKLDGVCPGSDHNGTSYCDDRPYVQAFYNAIQQCGRPMELTVSWKIDPAYTGFWQQYSNSRRVDDDIETYSSTLTGWNQVSWRFGDAANWCNSCGIGGGWMDLDSCDVGNGSMDGLTNDERQTLISFWAIECSDLNCGDDLYHFDSFGQWLIGNWALIGIDQAGHVATQVQGGNSQIWAAPNGDGSYTVGLFNLASSSAKITVNWSSLNMSGTHDVFDKLANADLGNYTNSYSVTLNSHASQVLHVGGGGVTYYKIVNRNSGMLLNIAGGWTVDGGHLIQYPDDGSPNSRWQLVPLSNGNYNIVNENSGKMINIPGPTTTAGTALIQYHKDGGSNSQWQMVSVGGGYYKFVSAYDGQVIDVAGQSTTAGTPIDQWYDAGQTNQQWSLVATSP